LNLYSLDPSLSRYCDLCSGLEIQIRILRKRRRNRLTESFVYSYHCSVTGYCFAKQSFVEDVNKIMSRKKHNVSYIKPNEPKFLRELKEQIGYKEGPTVDTKV